MDILIKNGHVIDPATKKNGIFDILIKNGKIEKVEKKIQETAETVIEAEDKVVTPGLIDMHVHLRQPGREDVETVASGTRAAVTGGMTSVSPMPNTCPAIDDREILKMFNKITEQDSLCNIFPVGAITKKRKGGEISDMEGMAKEGAVAFSDDGSSVADENILLEAMKKAKETGAFIISHCEDKAISGNGVMNEGMTATKLGLRGIPREAEYKIVERDIELAQKAKAKLHIAHVSCRESVDIIRKAKKSGVRVTAETAPHYFTLDETSCETYDTRTKMNPPLRARADTDAIKKALGDGTIDVIASDHAPHGKHEKEVEFDTAAFGIIGLETSLSLAIANLVEAGIISWERLVEVMSSSPAKILGLNDKGSLLAGKDADITIIDPEKNWIYTKNSIKSKSRNSPFIGWKFKGLATDVIVGGNIVMRDRKILNA